MCCVTSENIDQTSENIDQTKNLEKVGFVPFTFKEA